MVSNCITKKNKWLSQTNEMSTLILYTPTLVHNNRQLQATIVIMNQFLLDLGSYIYV